MPEFPPGAPHSDSQDPTASTDWKSALMDLISTRSEIIRLELLDFRKQASRRAAFLALALLVAASGWLLLLAGSVPLLAQVSGLSWPVMAIILAALHFLVFGILLALAQRKSGPAFPTTLSEFQKDRQWIEHINKTPKS